MRHLSDDALLAVGWFYIFLLAVGVGYAAEAASESSDQPVAFLLGLVIGYGLVQIVRTFLAMRALIRTLGSRS